MTAKERTDSLINLWLNDGRSCPRSMRDDIEQAIAAAAEGERKMSARILHEVYQAWVEGNHSPGEAFESAREKILYGEQAKKTLDELGEEYKILNHLADKKVSDVLKVAIEVANLCGDQESEMALLMVKAVMLAEGGMRVFEALRPVAEQVFRAENSWPDAI